MPEDALEIWRRELEAARARASAAEPPAAAPVMPSRLLEGGPEPAFSHAAPAHAAPEPPARPRRPGGPRVWRPSLPPPGAAGRRRGLRWVLAHDGDIVLSAAMGIAMTILLLVAVGWPPMQLLSTPTFGIVPVAIGAYTFWRRRAAAAAVKAAAAAGVAGAVTMAVVIPVWGILRFFECWMSWFASGC